MRIFRASVGDAFRHIIHKHLVYFLAVVFINAGRHARDDFCAPVVQHEQLSDIFIERKPFDLALHRHIVEDVFPPLRN